MHFISAILVPYQIYSKKFENENKEPYIMWFYRWELIKREIELYNPDIICFQEVQNDLFYRDLLPYLLEKKYMGHFTAMEPKVTDLSKYLFYEHKNSVGIAIFFKFDKFRLIHIQSFDYHKKVMNYYKKQNKELLSDNKFIKKILSPFANLTILFEDLHTSKRFYVSTIHIVSKPSLDDVKLSMIYLVLKNLNNLTKNNSLPLIFCGDFNSNPSSQVYKSIITGINKNEFNQLVQKPIISLPIKFLKYPLKSTYYTIFNQEPEYTNYTPEFKETLDYIFINNNCTVIGQLSQPDLSEKKRIPDYEYPSDHILQLAIIRL